MHRKTYTLIIGLFIFAAFISTPVFAVTSAPVKIQDRDQLRTNEPDKDQLREEAREEKTEVKMLRGEEKADAKCLRITNQIGTKSQKLQKVKQGHSVAFANLVSRLEKFIARFDERGYDTEVLKEDAMTLREMIDIYEGHYSVYIDLLGDSTNYVCGQKEGDFFESVVAAKEALAIMRADVAEIKAFYRDEVRVHILALKEQTPVTAVDEVETSTEILPETESTAGSLEE